ncbi:hypothetical protein [Streptomyces spectabilis]|uniref:Uncharacterized protein n=1 Tax=Streptomyces spectabilis TaxID=68270 RepID=A0A7W8B5A1_STRST|nr:hypothetical protein [Streptomyces spectabilis]MBB5109445.1 hypothetical protein [Streptomyces spectabilis]MCI3907794.1 hypothetical protein [Streptomyces spectabilis]
MPSDPTTPGTAPPCDIPETSTPTFTASLQFTAGGPAVTGQWSREQTARATFTSWIGLYGSNPDVVIRITATSCGRTRMLESWDHGRLLDTATDDTRPC